MRAAPWRSPAWDVLRALWWSPAETWRRGTGEPSHLRPGRRSIQPACGTGCIGARHGEALRCSESAPRCRSRRCRAVATVAVIGPNGAGKSTLLSASSPVWCEPTAGDLEIDGQASGGSGGPDRARIGYIGHATLLYPELSARENLVFAGRLYGVASPTDRADQLLAEEGLAKSCASRRAGTFSRGLCPAARHRTRHRARPTAGAARRALHRTRPALFRSPGACAFSKLRRGRPQRSPGNTRSASRRANWPTPWW